jgi:hypothetical protein
MPTMLNTTQRALDDVKILRHELVLIGVPVPVACPFELLGWTTNIYTSGTMLNPAAKAEDGPYIDMLRGIAIGWLAMPRTVEEIRAILSQKCRCNSKDAESRPHKQGASAVSESSYKDAMSTLVDMLFKTLLRIRSFPGRRPFDLDAREDWPIVLGELLPYGATDTMRGVLAWLKAPVDGKLATNIFNFIIQTLEICAPTILPSVIACDSLLDSLVGCIRSSADVFFSDQSNVRWDPIFVDAYHLLRSSITLLNAVLVSYADETQIHRFVGARGQAVLDAVQKGPDPLYLMMHRFQRRARGVPAGLTMDVLEVMDNMYNDIGGAIYDTYPEFHARTEGMVHRWQPVSRTFGCSVQDALWARFVKSLEVFVLIRQCRNPGCTNVFYHPHREQRFVCGGCRRTVYCGRQCQKRAWSHPTAPHRETCAALRYLCVTYHLSRRPTRRIRKPADVAYLDAARVVVDHFAALTTADMNTSSTWFECFLSSS